MSGRGPHQEEAGSPTPSGSGDSKKQALSNEHKLWQVLCKQSAVRTEWRACLLLSVLAFELIAKSEPLSQSHPVACEALRPSVTDIKVHTDHLKCYFIFLDTEWYTDQFLDFFLF